MAISGHFSLGGFMSAIGGKADIVSWGVLCPLLTQSGHTAEALYRSGLRQKSQLKWFSFALLAQIPQ
jgi:hypothetical protein